MEGSVEDVFASGAYWREYYTSLGHENREVGEFVAEVTRKISPGGGLKILDAGCGPTLLYWGVFAAGRNELYGFDLAHANIVDTHRRIEAARAGIVDPGLIEAARHAMTLFGGTETAAERVADKARQVVGVKVADPMRPESSTWCNPALPWKRSPIGTHSIMRLLRRISCCAPAASWSWRTPRTAIAGLATVGRSRPCS